MHSGDSREAGCWDAQDFTEGAGRALEGGAMTTAESAFLAALALLCVVAAGVALWQMFVGSDDIEG